MKTKASLQQTADAFYWIANKLNEQDRWGGSHIRIRQMRIGGVDLPAELAGGWTITRHGAVESPPIHGKNLVWPVPECIPVLFKVAIKLQQWMDMYKNGALQVKCHLESEPSFIDMNLCGEDGVLHETCRYWIDVCK